MNKEPLVEVSGNYSINKQTFSLDSVPDKSRPNLRVAGRSYVCVVHTHDKNDEKLNTITMRVIGSDKLLRDLETETTFELVVGKDILATGVVDKFHVLEG